MTVRDSGGRQRNPSSLSLSPPPTPFGPAGRSGQRLRLREADGEDQGIEHQLVPPGRHQRRSPGRHERQSGRVRDRREPVRDGNILGCFLGVGGCRDPGVFFNRVGYSTVDRGES